MKSVRVRITCLVCACLAALPGATFTLYYTHLLPEHAWYYEFRSWPGTEFLVAFTGAACGVIASFLPGAGRFLPLLAAAGFSVIPFLKPIVSLVSTGTFRDRWDGDVCLQSTPSTCGAASTASVLRAFHISATEAEIAVDAYSYSHGTEAWYLARAARARGLQAAFDFTSGFKPERGLPAVVGVRIGTLGHFIAVLGMENGKYITGDPLRGRELLSRAELEQRYKFTGFHLRIKPKD